MSAETVAILFDFGNECLDYFLVLVTYLAITLSIVAIIVAGAGFLAAAYSYTKLVEYAKNWHIWEDPSDFEEALQP